MSLLHDETGKRSMGRTLLAAHTLQNWIWIWLFILGIARPLDSDTLNLLIGSLDVTMFIVFGGWVIGPRSFQYLFPQLGALDSRRQPDRQAQGHGQPLQGRRAMTGQLIWAPMLTGEILNEQYGQLREDRQGILLHYDGSGSDRGSMQWFGDPRCHVSYNLLVLDDGSYVRIAPDHARAWHAGRCRPSDPDRLHYGDANSALLGIAIASSGKHDVTPLQMLTVALLCRIYYEKHGWNLRDTWRIVGHSSEAWPRGRKTDPEGADPNNPILSVDDVRQLLPKVSRT